MPLLKTSDVSNTIIDVVTFPEGIVIILFEDFQKFNCLILLANNSLKFFFKISTFTVYWTMENIL